MNITYLAGVVLATGAAVGFALQQVFIRLGTDDGKTFDALVVVILTNIVVIVPPTLVLYYPTYGLTPTAILMFTFAGLGATLLGRLFHYTSIERVGASRSSPIVSSDALFAALVAVLILGERLSAEHFIGVVLIVVGVAAISRELSQDSRKDLSTKELLIGLSLPLFAAFLYGVEPTLAKIGFNEGTPFLVGLTIKTVGAIIGFLLYLHWANAVPSTADLNGPNTKWYVAAGAANTAFLLCYYAALTIAPVIVVYPIIPSSILLVLVVSYLYLPRRLEIVSPKLAASSLVIIAGVLIITMYS